MLYVKAEDGKVLEIIRSQFKDMKEVLEHSQKIFGMASDHILVTPPIHGSCGVLITSYKSIGKQFPEKSYFFRFYSTVVEVCLVY